MVRSCVLAYFILTVIQNGCHAASFNQGGRDLFADIKEVEKQPPPQSGSGSGGSGSDVRDGLLSQINLPPLQSQNAAGAKNSELEKLLSLLNGQQPQPAAQPLLQPQAQFNSVNQLNTLLASLGGGTSSLDQLLAQLQGGGGGGGGGGGATPAPVTPGNL